MRTRKRWPVGVLAVLVTLMVVSNLVNYRATLRETTQPQQTGALQDQPVRYVVAQRLNTYRMKQSSSASERWPYLIRWWQADASPPPTRKLAHMSDVSLEQLWAGVDGVWTEGCERFDGYCRDLTEEYLAAVYKEREVEVRYYPGLEDVLVLLRTARAAQPLVRALTKADASAVSLLRQGRNLRPPSVGVVFDAWITRAGSLLSPAIGLPSYPDPSTLPVIRQQYFPPPTSKPPTLSSDAASTGGSVIKPMEEWRKVKEVVVISHLHQSMYWHRMVNEYFRVFALLPWVRENPDIAIHIACEPRRTKPEAIRAFFELLNISADRLITYENVQAEVAYYTQPIDRDDVPSMGLTQLVSRHLWDALGIPEARRVSILSPSIPIILPSSLSTRGHAAHDTRQHYQQRAPLEVTLLCVVRNSSTRGRMLANYGELKDLLAELAQRYPTKLIAAGLAVDLTITIAEHLSSLPFAAALSLFARADIILGPHGAGFANLFAARPGAHVIELVTERHLNFLTTGRLGMAYHAVVATRTRDGLDATTEAHYFNFHANTSLLLGIIEKVLDSRFLT